MLKPDSLQHGPSGESAIHICVDLQRVLADPTELTMPPVWQGVAEIASLVALHPERTIFTHFVPAKEPGQGSGVWRDYCDPWSSMTFSHLGRDRIEIVPTLTRSVPPPRVINKLVHSLWTGTDFHLVLRRAGILTIILTGAEADVCALSPRLGAVDWGFRVILVTDALCSSADQTRDAIMEIYGNRLGE